jgi:hypothetical protein
MYTKKISRGHGWVRFNSLRFQIRQNTIELLPLTTHELLQLDDKSLQELGIDDVERRSELNSHIAELKVLHEVYKRTKKANAK